MDEWRKVVAAYRKNKVSYRHMTDFKRDPPIPVGTDHPIGHEIPVDDGFLTHVAQELASKPLAHQRIGRNWLSGDTALVSKRTNDDMWIAREDLRILDDVCTRFTTKRFFPDAHTRVNMVINMIRIYDRAAKVAKQPYYIVFKGGVMLRLQLLEFLHDLDVEVRYEAIQYLSDAQRAVGVSDFDFEIVPTSHNQSEGETWRQVLTNAIYLLWIRRYLERYAFETNQKNSGSERNMLIDNTWDYAEAEHELKEMLRVQVKELPSTHPLYGCTIDHVHIPHPKRDPPVLEHRTRYGRSFPSPRENIMIFKCVASGRDETCVTPMRDVLRTIGCSKELLQLTDVQHGCLYTTTNYHIGEHEPRGHKLSMLSNFHLSRIKHAFVMYYTTQDGERRVDRLSGEVIDLSQSHGGVYDERRRHMYADVPNPYRVYPIPNTNHIIRSYTIDALLHDLQDILHHGPTAPWDNPKVDKRLVRYSFLLVLEVLRGTQSMEHRQRALKALVSYVSNPGMVASRKMHSTGFESIDTFAAHEHMSASHHGISEAARVYYATLSKHLITCIELVTRNEELKYRGMRWHTTPLNAMHVEHDDLR